MLANFSIKIVKDDDADIFAGQRNWLFATNSIATW